MTSALISLLIKGLSCEFPLYSTSTTLMYMFVNQYIFLSVCLSISLGQEEKCPLASTFHDDLREGFVRGISDTNSSVLSVM